MKIFQVIPCFAFGGAEIMCENMLYSLRAAGHEVAAVSLFDYHSPITERIESAGIKIYYMGKRPGPDLTMTGKLKRLFAASTITCCSSWVPISPMHSKPTCMISL